MKNETENRYTSQDCSNNMITTQQIQKYVHSISEVAVSKDRMSITVVCRDLTGFEPTGAGGTDNMGKFWTDLLTKMNAFMDNSTSIVGKLQANYLRRCEQGIMFVAKDDYVWKDAHASFNKEDIDADDKTKIGGAEIRVGSLYCGTGLGGVWPVGHGGVVKFYANPNCPRMAMLMLYRIFDEDPNVMIVGTDGYPDDEDCIWHGGIAGVWGNSI